MECKEYNDWRRDVVAEYVLTTGKVLPHYVARELVDMSDWDEVPSPQAAIFFLTYWGII